MDNTQHYTSTENKTPQITSFQFSKESIGKIKDSVNLFRGTVSLPLNLVSLPGYEDLDVNVMLLYGSNVKSQLENWNLTHPTGVAGLGWNMLEEQIVVQKNNSGTQISDQYYLRTGGTSERLIQTGTTFEGLLKFQTRNYEFWDILYDPQNERWTITRSNGCVYTYGGKTGDANAVEYGVKWGNWMGSSALTNGQEHYVRAWNLTEKKNVWGNTVSYVYQQTTQTVGDSFGLEYTQASYLKEITDSLGRKLLFSYGEKYGANNPGTQGIVEYQAQHTQSSGASAYQDLYETLYLERIDIINELGSKLFAIHFGYEFMNLSPDSNPSYALLYKRILTKVWQESAEGRILPGYEFEYFNQTSDVSPGSLKNITFPYGGKAGYTYKNQTLKTGRNLKISSPSSGSIPRVWHGPDYTVVTWYNASSHVMEADVFSWSGTWTKTMLSSSSNALASFTGVDIDMESLGVVTQENYICLYFTNKTTNSTDIYLYNRNQTSFGTFDLKTNPQKLNLKQGATFGTQVTFGDNYIIAANKDFSDTPFYGFQWKWKERVWDNVSVLPSFSDAANADYINISAQGNYYITCFYTNASKTGKFQLIYHDGVDIWHSGSEWFNTFTVFKDSEKPEEFPFTFSLAESMASCTYVTDISSDQIKYEIRTFQWDVNFFALNPSSPLIGEYTSAIIDEKAQFNVLQTFNDSALLANNPNLNRYVGGPGNSNNLLCWFPKTFTTTADQKDEFAFGTDVAVMTEKVNNTYISSMYQFNPDFPNSGGWGSPIGLDTQESHPTISGNVLTVGKDVFYRQTNGQWTKQQIGLNKLQAPETVQNRASGFITYQDTTENNAQTYIAFVQNGQLNTPQMVNRPDGSSGQKIYIEDPSTLPGTQLVGYDAFVTYPADQDFDKAGFLTLYRVENQEIAGDLNVTAVANVHIENLIEEASFWQSYSYQGSVDSTITYDAVNDLPQFPMVQVIPSTQSPEDVTYPEGSTVYYFSNGVSKQSGLPFGFSWVYNYNMLLNGNLLGKKEYDTTGKEVASEVNYYRIKETNPEGTGFLYAGYAQLIQTSKAQDGVTKTTVNTYYDSIGQLKSAAFSYYNSEGKKQTLMTEKTYAIQVDAYSQSMRAKNILNNIVQQVISVTDEDSQVTTITSSSATTWKNWGSADNEQWAAYEKYQWLGTGDSPEFDFTNPGSSSDWGRTNSVVSRTPETGNITEQRALNGMVTSYVYDTKGQHQIAEFPNTSIENNEAGYYSFESIENSGAWDIQSGGQIIPNATYTQTDAHTGVNSLRIQSGETGIQGAFTPKGDTDSFILSCFFKVPESFNPDQGKAGWEISFLKQGSPLGSPVRIDFPDVTNTWSYFSTPVNLAELQASNSGDITVQMQCVNANTSQFVLIDNVRFSPLDSTMGAVNLSVESSEINASIGANGETKRFLYDDFQQEIASTTNADAMSAIHAWYYSRSGNEGIFNPEYPNSFLVVNAAEGGTFCDFTKGNAYLKVWTPDNQANWNIEDTTLNYTASTLGSLKLKDSSVTSQYGISVKVNPKEAPKNPMGIRIGNQYEVKYTPANNQWQLVDLTSSGNTLQQAVFKGLVNPTSSGDTVFGTQWLLLVGEKSILFFVDGQLLINQVMDTKISGVPELFMADPVEIAYLITTRQNRINMTYTNGTANDQQSQIWMDTQVSAIQNMYDAMGRAAIHTKPAYIQPTSGTGILMYRTDLATYNWSTETMSGLIQTIYPEDQGYPYFREVYEASPLGRVIESSMPGLEFSIGHNTAKSQYGSNDGTLGLPKNQFYKNVQIDQNGNIRYTLTDQRGGGVYKLSQSGDSEFIKTFNQLNAFGLPVKQFVPNYFNPPAQSTAEDWIVENGYDFLGRNISTLNSDSGDLQKVYDPSGNMRFRQDAQGRVDGNYQYFKYDIYGRLKETGYLADTWDFDTLQIYANTQPNWPETPDTWRKKFSFNGNGDQPNQIGNLIKVEVNSGTQNTVSSTEEYAYDINGNILTKSFVSEQAGGNTWVIDYVYNSIGDMTEVHYPTKDNTVPLIVSYVYNTIGQVAKVLSGKAMQSLSAVAEYTYNASGKPETEVLNGSGTNPVTRQFTYNSPVWLETIEATIKGSSEPLFKESLHYTAQETGEESYFNGQPSSWSFNYQSKSDDYANREAFTFNPLGGIADHRNTVTNHASTYSYDGNSNFTTVNKKGTDVDFNYNKNNSVSTLNEKTGGSTLSTYTYNANGNIRRVVDTPDGKLVSRQLAFGYDPGVLLTRTILNEKENGISYNFEYDGMNQRVVKQTLNSGNVEQTKVYIRGLNTSALMEFMNEEEDIQYFIFGPLGMLAQTDLSETQFLIRDHLNSTRVVVNSESEVCASYAYDIFGTLETLYENTTMTCSYLYTGQEWDKDLGLYNFRSRFYFAEIGRFAAIDPGEQFYSPYIYAGNNPVLFIDPSGNFSIGNFFSAIAGAIIGVVEIAIGVAIDVVAGVLEVVTGGLSTPASVGLAALSGFFYGAGTSALVYSTVGLVTNDFSWKDYGISMGIGAVTGSIGSAFGAAGAAVQASAKASITAATEAGRAASTLAKVANVAAKPAFAITGSAVAGTTGAFLNNVAYGNRLDSGLGEAFISGIITGTLGWAIPTPDYDSGWGEFAKRTVANVGISEGVGVGMQLGSNAIHGERLDNGLLNTLVSGLVDGTVSAIGANDYGKAKGKEIDDGFTNMFKDIEISM